MANNRTIEEPLQAPTEGRSYHHFKINADHFEIKTNLLQVVQANSYHGFKRENPHTHINNFKRFTSTLKFRDVPNDVIKLMMFSDSLEGNARVWDNASKSNDRIDKLSDQISTLVDIFAKQIVAPALIKAVEESCVTCGGAHAYYNCLNTDSKQPSVCVTTCTYNHVVPQNRASNYMAPPGFALVQNGQNRFNKNQGQGNNFNQRNNFQPFQVPNQGLQKQPFQVPNNPVQQAILLKKLPKKLGDHGKFLLSCDFLGMDVCHALADLGASINLMPLSIWKKLSLPELTPTLMTLELEDRSITRPKGVAEDVFVKVGKFHFLTDFVVVEITLRVNDEAVTFNLNQTTRYSSTYDDLSVNRIDIIDVAREKYAQEILGFSNNSLDGNPTSTFKPILSDSSPSLTPFEGSDFILEEIDAYLKDESVSLEIDHKGEIVKEKSLIEEPPELELKELPSHLEYAYLEGVDKLPVIIEKYLKVDEKEALLKGLKSHKRAIAWKITDIKGIDPRFCTDKILMEEDYNPVMQSQRRVNPKIHEVIKKEVIKLLDAVENENNKLIPTQLVIEWRVCIDYRKLNDATRKDHFPLPFMDQMLERLAGNEFYCFLDGFSGYFHIPINPPNKEKTTFTCPYGTFAYRIMPFGLCNAPRTFQRCMMAIFHDMIEKTKEVFMDDVSIFEDSFSSCLSHLDTMLQRCENTNLVLNCEKCHFMVKEGIVLGHKISKNRLEVDHSKVYVIAKMPYPTTVKGVRSFLGHVSFYRRFIQDFSKIARHMTPLLEKETSFVFSEDFIDAFETLKKKLTEAPILVVPDWNLPFKLMWVHGKEAYDILKACHEEPTGGHHGANFIANKILWDHFRLHEGIELEHKAHLALKHVNFDLKAASDYQKLQLNELNELRDQAYENSLIYKEKMKKIHDSKIKNCIFNVGDRVLLFNSCLKIFLGKLETRWLGPFTITKAFSYGTVELSQPDGPNFKIKSFKGVCMVKKLMISSKLVMKDPPGAIMVPISPPRKYILVAVDYLSKWVEAKVLLTNDARVIVKFLKSLFARFGTPRAIISNRGTHFCNDKFAKVMSKYGVTHHLSTAYHPQISGQVEVSNRGLKCILERTVGENHASWLEKLDDAL
nr:DNA-directed DNA polymerase [Tanacetum cinerariifolium]